VLTYVMLGWGLNVVVGLAAARPRLCRILRRWRLFLRQLLAPISASRSDRLALAGILAAFSGVLLGFPVLRLRGDYLAIVTLAFARSSASASSLQSLTGGPERRQRDFPRPSFFGIPLTPGDDGLAACWASSFRQPTASYSCSI